MQKIGKGGYFDFKNCFCELLSSEKSGKVVILILKIVFASPFQALAAFNASVDRLLIVINTPKI